MEKLPEYNKKLNIDSLTRAISILIYGDGHYIRSTFNENFYIDEKAMPYKYELTEDDKKYILGKDNYKSIFSSYFYYLFFRSDCGLIILKLLDNNYDMDFICNQFKLINIDNRDILIYLVPDSNLLQDCGYNIIYNKVYFNKTTKILFEIIQTRKESIFNFYKDYKEHFEKLQIDHLYH